MSKSTVQPLVSILYLWEAQNSGLWNSQLSMNNPLLLLLLSNAVYSEARFILHSKAEVSKVVPKVIKNYSLKDESSKIGGLGAFFFDTCSNLGACSNLGQLSPYKFKNMYTQSSRNLDPKIYPFPYCIRIVRTIF